MKQRCYNPNNKSYRNYGGRGIKICDEWLNNNNGFSNFYKWCISNNYDENKDGSNQSIDRINNNGDYSPNNCRITNKITQANNTRRNMYYTYNSKTQTLSEWSREVKIPYNVLYNRTHCYNWTIDKAIETPSCKK